MKTNFPHFSTESCFDGVPARTTGIATTMDQASADGGDAVSTLNLHSITSEGHYGGYLQLPEDADVLRDIADELHRAADSCQAVDVTFQINALTKLIDKLAQEQMIAREDVEHHLVEMIENDPATTWTDALQPDASPEEILKKVVMCNLYDEAFEAIAKEAPFEAIALRQIAEKDLDLPQWGSNPDDQTQGWTVVAVICRNASGEPDFVVARVKASKADQNNGVHYDRAIEQAEGQGYQGDFTAFDQDEADRLAKGMKAFRWLSRH